MTCHHQPAQQPSCPGATGKAEIASRERSTRRKGDLAGGAASCQGAPAPPAPHGTALPATACLSDRPLRGSTPYARFEGESVKRPRVLRVQRLPPQACLPVRALPGSAGLGLRLPRKEITLERESHHLVSMELAISIPQGRYGRVAGVIDLNRIPQLICERIRVPPTQEGDSLRPSQQPGGFGASNPTPTR
uniref:dUTPase-like domain-containing protein n=1 Tax=Apteryx owenii TaxID=8824 RepID=A0A8B9QMN9_APTOW